MRIRVLRIAILVLVGSAILVCGLTIVAAMVALFMTPPIGVTQISPGAAVAILCVAGPLFLILAQCVQRVTGHIPAPRRAKELRLLAGVYGLPAVFAVLWSLLDGSGVNPFRIALTAAVVLVLAGTPKLLDARRRVTLVNSN